MKNKYYQLTINEEFNAKDVRTLLRYYGLSKKSIYLIELNKGVLINYKPATTFTILKLSDQLMLDLTSINQKAVTPVDEPIDIVYEDDALLVVNKQARLLVHSDGVEIDTLNNRVANYKNQIENPYEILPCHRIDTDTTGMVVFGKNPLVVSYLSQLFENRQIKKTYHSIVNNEFDDLEGVIDLPLSGDRHSNKQVIASNGQYAYTTYKVLKNGERPLVEISITGGRKHQIRAHMAYIGHGVVGDKIYSRDDSNIMYLHFSEAEFIHPTTLTMIKISCKPQFL
ncbi:MAG TPA: RluA family pseudouridine synthase [Acholeplasma sp.]|nr:RluA family pseudouridine synthase [Acholeplasma sp.]